MSVNIFGEPRERKRAELTITIHDNLIEFCSEVIHSMTLLIPEYKSLFRYTDLYPCKSKLNRYIELMTPIYVIKKNTITGEIPEWYIDE